MTTTEVAAYLHVTRAWVWRLIKRGDLVAEMRGRDWWIEEAEVWRYMRERRPAHRPKIEHTAHDAAHDAPDKKTSKPG